MGRPKKDLDWKLLDILCSRKMFLKDCAEILNVSEDLIENRIKKYHNCTFTAYRDKKLARTRLNLVEKALDMALKKSDKTMLIFCLKNICGWTDVVKQEITEDKDHRILINYNTVSKDNREGS